MPVLGLFSWSHLPYNIDRNATPATAPLPSLATTTQKALELFGDNSFFLMVEGSRIDMAQHNNDLASAYYEFLDFDGAIQVALNYAKNHDDTLVIITADHETGGFTLGAGNYDQQYPGYNYIPTVMFQVQRSAEFIMQQLIAQNLSTNVSAIQDAVFSYTGLSINSAYETAYLTQAIQVNTLAVQAAIGYLVSHKGLNGYTTPSHTAVDVNLYAYGSFIEDLICCDSSTFIDNTELAPFLASQFGLDLESVTEKLKNMTVPSNKKRSKFHDFTQYHQ